MAKVTLRAMTDDDLAAVVAMAQSTQRFAWQLSDFQMSLHAGSLAQVLCLNGELSGFCVIKCVLDEAEVLNIAVAPLWQGQGYGRHFLTALMQTLQRQGMKRFYLEVRASARVAQYLYQRLGFEIINTRRNYYPSEVGREDAYCMRYIVRDE